MSKKQETIGESLIRTGLMDEESLKEMERGFKKADKHIEAEKRKILSSAKRMAKL